MLLILRREFPKVLFAKRKVSTIVHYSLKKFIDTGGVFMIHITRPITQTQKTVPKTEDKSLDNHLSERKAPELVVYSKEQGQARDYSREDLERAVEDSNELIFRNEEQFKFEVHERTNRIMVKLVNTQTDEIIKEIPPEKILDLVANIWDLVGILVDERA